ncbi:site-specific integrase [Enterobacter hormaechei]|jgi:integrase|uniref:tyrosine-type recombinase/integrase n=1 Tax=Enterobacter cloacae complex TaxID=354276 RepID=UPI0020569158|nr:site-specific integrase [Enterobacter kobei]MCR2775488.1 site-specific integrase [Enterobacter kobei]DAZ64442.1 MAG TPA: Integrase [Caudoviricetes sp.]
MSKYPTGVENHGGTLRLWFIYKGVRVREGLGVPDTPKNRKVAGELRTSICYAIKTGNFVYSAQFPNSKNLQRFGESMQEITIGELCKKWLVLKEMEVAESTMITYGRVTENVLAVLNHLTLVSSVTKERLLELRRELLTGYQTLKKGHKTVKKGRSSVTVNNYMTVMYGLFQFAVENGYISRSPMTGMSPLRESRPDPDPITRDEFPRLIDACHHQQSKNLWAIAVYTGLRPGELCGLAWEDVDLKAGTVTVRRSLTQKGKFTLPKTDAGTNRVIHLITPALDAFRSQYEMTRLSQEHNVQVQLREYGKKEQSKCTFVFLPSLTARAGNFGKHFSINSIGNSWDAAMKRAGLRHRKSYQSRHTYACWSLSAGANPNFIANQMGHADAQMVFQVYGKWMEENNLDQIAMLSSKLSEFAPTMPQRNRPAA